MVRTSISAREVKVFLVVTVTYAMHSYGDFSHSLYYNNVLMELKMVMLRINF